MIFYYLRWKERAGKERESDMAVYIALILLGIIEAAILELNKNTLLGWGLAAVVLIGFGILYKRKIRNKKKEVKAPWYLRILSWTGLLVVLGALIPLTVGPYKLVPAVKAKNPKKSEVIELADGKVQGVQTKDGKVEVYAGIPYAAAPVGDLRWKEPQDPSPWKGVLTCDKFKPMSMQPANPQIYNSLAQIIGYHDYTISLDDNYRTMMSEDSLYVNVWKPEGDVSNCPVLVYIHGGSLQTGQPWYDDYNGETFARDGVVVVNFAYRLGVFGYYADEALQDESNNGSTGNYGLLDQVKALQWVQENIASFGGDPKNVTLAGESAGAAAVGALCTSPLAKGTFQRVIAESSSVESVVPPHSFRSMDEALKTGDETKKELGITIGNSKTEKKEALKKMRSLSAGELVGMADRNHHMTVDGYALTETPYESYQKGIHNEEAILNGYNANEAGAFLVLQSTKKKDYKKAVSGMFSWEGGSSQTGNGSLSTDELVERVIDLYPSKTDEEANQNYTDLFTAYYFSYSHSAWTRLARANQEPVYEYYFSKENGRLSTWHSGEEVYLYGNIPTGKEAGANLYDDSDLQASEVFHSYALNFIRTGDPNGKMSGTIYDKWKGKDLEKWSVGDGETLKNIGDDYKDRKDPFLKLYQLLDQWQGFN